MNSNLVTILKQIIAHSSEEILADSRRLKAFFADLAKDEPKPLRTAFGCCIEAEAYNALKTAPDAAERVSRKAKIVQRVHDEHGLDRAFCAEALDILETVLYGTVSTPEKATPVPQSTPSVTPPSTYTLRGSEKAAPCPACGAGVSQGFRFCPACGAAAASGGAAPSQQPAAPVRNAKTCFDSGEIFRSRGDYVTAIEEYTQAIRLDPN
ncbi:MAG: tetratricopeptide repeat protein, partial [Treponema sp.]|nr:tetratricopeptide repeat protein [Treponema sp.]